MFNFFKTALYIAYEIIVSLIVGPIVTFIVVCAICAAEAEAASKTRFWTKNTKNPVLDNGIIK